MMQMESETLPLGANDGDLEYGTASTTSEEEENGKSCLGHCGLVDYSEPCIYVLGVIGVVGLVMGLIPPSTLVIVVAAGLIILAGLAAWRVRRLGVAYALMESVETLRVENEHLRLSVVDLDAQVNRFKVLNTELIQTREALGKSNKELKEIVGLVGDKVENIDEATEKLLGLYQNCKQENLRQERNNLLALFEIIDKDKDGVLEEAEIAKLTDYVKKAFGRSITDFDTDKDGGVTYAEFVNQLV